MRYASALFYNAQLIDAVDADYDDYKGNRSGRGKRLM